MLERSWHFSTLSSLCRNGGVFYIKSREFQGRRKQNFRAPVTNNLTRLDAKLRAHNNSFLCFDRCCLLGEIKI